MNIFSSIIRSLGIKGIAKGSTLSAQATVTTVDADHNALDVTVLGTPALPADAATETTLAALDAKVTACDTGAVTVSALPALATGSNTIGAVTAPGAAALALDATLTGGSAIAIAKGAAATGAGVSGNPVYTAGIDGGGLVRPTLHSAAGNAQVSIAKGTSYSSAAAESSAVVSASACSPSMVNVRNLTGTTRYVQFFDAGALPANGTVPKFMFMLTANSDQQKTFPCAAGRFPTAMTVASSSTAGTLTFSAGTDLLIQVDLYPSST